MTSCSLCAAEPASFSVSVEGSPKQGWVLATPLLICDGCADLVESGSDEEFAARLEGFEGIGTEAVVAHLRINAGPPMPLAPPDAWTTQHLQMGFEPLAEHSGAVELLGPLWPSEHRVSGPPDEAGEATWMVRSPWPALTVAEVLQVLWRWVEREPYVPNEHEHQRIIEVFGWSDDQAREHLDDVT